MIRSLSKMINEVTGLLQVTNGTQTIVTRELRDPQVFGPESWVVKIIIPYGTKVCGVYPNIFFVKEAL